MKRLGSLLLTGALALSLWVLPAGAAEIPRNAPRAFSNTSAGPPAG